MMCAWALLAITTAVYVALPPSEFPSRLSPIDPSLTHFSNDMYDEEEIARSWWDAESAFSYGLHTLNPIRLKYFDDTFEWVLLSSSSNPRQKSAIKILDIGCGGGLLTEGLARAGYDMVGVDLSPRSVAEATRHAAEQSLRNVRYVQGSAYDLSAFDDESFDAVVMSDVLEHLHNLPQLMREVGRVLKRGGVFAFDTINRTWWSWVAIKQVGEFRGFLLPAGSHDWRMFITPEEVETLMATVNVGLANITGIEPVFSPSNMLAKWSLRSVVVDFGLSADISGSYAGYGVKV